MALECLLDLNDNPPAPDALYTEIVFPEPPENRPYIFVNMVSTADGKIVLGEIGGSAKGVGGSTDQRLFRRLQQRADAALIGSSTLRASQVIYPPEKLRYVVTRTGDAPLNNRFFRDAPEKAFIIAPEDLPDAKRDQLAGANLIQAGIGSVDLPAALHFLRERHGVRHLLCEGGATLNDELMRAGLADELFLTLAPKIKGGSRLPTIVEGEGFPSGQFLPLTLRSIYRDGDEVYFRYRLAAQPETTK